jgi:CelD/BcsL family acetyltransferase involved in cellulose biosynthesis
MTRHFTEVVKPAQPILIVERIEDTAQFESLREEWNELLVNSAADCVFLTWEWLFTWWKHLAGDRRLHVIMVRNADDRLIAVAPLALRSRRWKRLLPFPALEFLGTGSIGSDYLDLIIRRGEEHPALAALADYFAKSELILEFSQVMRTGAHALDLTLQLKRLGWEFNRTVTDLCPFIDLSGHDWDSYVASLGRAHRYNLRRRLKSLGRQGTFRFEQAVSEPQRAESMQTVYSLHYLRWRRRGGRGVFRHPSVVAFHDEISRLAFRRGWLRLYVLRFNQKAAAAWYGFHYHGTTSFYQSGLDPALDRHSVGLVAMGLAIRHAIEQGARFFDFLRGNEPYKMLWTQTRCELVRLQLFPPCARGAVYKKLTELRSRLKKRVWHYLPGAG